MVFQLCDLSGNCVAMSNKGPGALKRKFDASGLVQATVSVLGVPDYPALMVSMDTSSEKWNEYAALFDSDGLK